MAKVKKIPPSTRLLDESWAFIGLYISLDRSGDLMAALELSGHLGLHVNVDSRVVTGSRIPSGCEDNSNAIREMVREICHRINSRANQLTHPNRRDYTPTINPDLLKPITLKEVNDG